MPSSALVWRLEKTDQADRGSGEDKASCDRSEIEVEGAFGELKDAEFSVQSL